jgi:hypothetical protein
MLPLRCRGKTRSIAPELKKQAALLLCNAACFFVSVDIAYFLRLCSLALICGELTAGTALFSIG